MISLEVNQDYLKNKERFSQRWFNKITKSISKELKLKNNFKVSLAFVDNKTIKKLNKLYRNVDKVTDVLSFSYQEEEGNLGEVIICYPQAKKQAEARKHSVEQEVKKLLIHGILHLLGYDHKKKRDRELMKALGNKIGQLLK